MERPVRRIAVNGKTGGRTLSIKTLQVGILALAVLLSGCKTMDPYTREEEMSKASRGAILGAAAGAVVGLVTGEDAVDRRQRALIGAGIGALAGGSVGYYMDRQEAELRAKLENTGVSVFRDGDNITLNMPGNVTFATDSADLNADFFEVLDSVGLVLKEYEQTLVEVAGHTDSTGTDAYNQALSDRRAISVARYIEARNIDSQRLMPIGMGETRPVADNGIVEGRQANRRVELTIVPLTAS